MIQYTVKKHNLYLGNTITNSFNTVSPTDATRLSKREAIKLAKQLGARAQPVAMLANGVWSDCND